MKLTVLTAQPRGLASLALADLARSPEHEVVAVVYSDSLAGGARRPHLRRKVRKVRTIGLLGAVNGVRMRRWFSRDVAKLLSIEDIHQVAAEMGVPIEHVPHVNHPDAQRLIAGMDSDLGISLGNSYISHKTFSLPSEGMINVHHELLPEYRGAQSVIWQIHDGSSTTGYTIHRIDRTLDGGAILYQEKLPIDVRSTVRATVGNTCAALYRASISGLLQVVDNYPQLAHHALPQGSGRSLTTPSAREYHDIVRRHKELKRAAMRERDASYW